MIGYSCPSDPKLNVSIITGRPCRNITIPNSNTTNIPGVYEDQIHVECNLGFSYTENGTTRILEYDSQCLATGEWSKNITCEGWYLSYNTWMVHLKQFRASFRVSFRVKCKDTFFYLLDYWETEPKLCKIIILLQALFPSKNISIRLEVNFNPKHQLICSDYHSNGFYLSFYVSTKQDNHFVAILQLFLLFYLSFFYFRKLKCGE